MTESRRQKTDARRQTAEAGRQTAEAGRQTAEAGRQTPEARRTTGDPDSRPFGRPMLQPSDHSGIRSSGFLTRAFSGLRGTEAAEWGRENGLTPSLAFSHNLIHVFPPALYRQKPEFFPLVEGKRLEPPTGSYFWNPDIAREDAAIHAANVARQHFDAHPGAVSFALGVNDALIWGESPELLALLANGKWPMGDGQGQMANGKWRKTNGQAPTLQPSPGSPNTWFRGRPDYSNVVFTFMNRAAAALSRTHSDKYLGALAYYWCENIPDFPIHPRVVPFLTADRSQGYDVAFWKEEMELQEKWGRLAGRPTADARGQTPDAGRQTPDTGSQPTDGRHRKPDAGQLGTTRDNPGSGVWRLASGVNAARRLGMYDYLYGAGFVIPRIHTRLMAENLRHARRAGFTDYYAEVNPNWGLDGPMPWLTAQLLQDPEQSRGALLEEYYERYFREAAEPMRRFFEKCEQQWMAQPGPSYWLKHFRNESQAGVFPPHIRGALRLHLTGAEVMAGSRKVRERVRLVSDAFGLTERFCDFNEAREALAVLLANGQWQMANGQWRMANGGAGRQASGANFPTGSEALQHALASYLDARRQYIRHALTLQHEQPLALHPVNHDDFLRNNPGFAAAVRLLEASAGDARVADVLRRRPESWLHAAADFHEARTAGRLRAFLPAGSLEGPLVPGRRIAGLQYGVDLPAPWQSRLEPTETHVAAVTAAAARTGTAGLRISGALNSTVYQWVPVTGGQTVVASVFARARVSPSDAVTLTLGWLDAQHRPVGTVVVVRIPDGERPDWIQLQQGAPAPANAAWAGIGIRVQNQVAGDWVEFDDFSLVEVTGR